MTFLTGFMGCGKTSVGRELARLVSVQFIDLDEQIVKSSGKSIKEIFTEHSEAHFRQLERELLTQIVAHQPAVVSLGGGTFINPQNRRLIIQNGISVFLHCSLETIYKRLQNDTLRPLFSDRSNFEKLYRERLPIYQLADLQLDVSSLSIEEAASKIAEMLIRVPPKA
ncbi:MAG: shikimate kinase [Blastocatellia bacterium]|nr:shikimate kinase [Blastocatellia bacterium]